MSQGQITEGVKDGGVNFGPGKSLPGLQYNIHHGGKNFYLRFT